MDLSCIISSGDLELYVLGMLPEDEAYKISQLAVLFEEIEEEINRIRETLHVLSDEAEIAPGPHVRENFIKTIQQLKAEETAIVDTPISQETAIVNTPVIKQVDEAEEPAKVVSMGKRSNAKQFLLAASIIALVACIGCIVYLINKNDQYQQQLASVETRLQNNQKQVDDYAQTIAMMQDPSTLKIQLKSVAGRPPALVQVFWNKNTSAVMLSDVSLPAVPKGKQYQLWAIVKGKPVDAGMLSSNKQTLQKMKTFEEAEAFAITLEKEGGSPTPTMEEMYVMAAVS